MKYYVIAGEASGDLHASNLMAALKERDPDAVFRGWGGDLMRAQGADLVKHYRELAFMGFSEVLMNLRTILRSITNCKEDIAAWKPDMVILVDYPGFNLRIAPFAKELGIPVYYYISPQIWAWKQSRVHKIKEVVDHMFVILPFEKAFYSKFDYKVDFVGHPLLDAMSGFRTEIELPGEDTRPVVALLPGSRRQEIGKMLPVMLDCATRFPQFRFVIAGAPSMPEAFYKEVMGERKAEIVFGKTYALLQRAYAALVTSGTATLETALFNVPEVVCYRGSAVSYQIAKRLVKVKYISLVNLIMDREVVTELIQHDFTVSRLERELRNITEDKTNRHRMLDDFEKLRKALGGGGASATTAELILRYYKEKKAKG